jgi:nitrogen fixation protein FixH
MKRGWQWPVLVALALMFTVGVNVVMLFAARGDPNGTVVEPDYYRKAVEWDRAMARQKASDALKWTVTADISASTNASTNASTSASTNASTSASTNASTSASRQVRVVLRDSAGVAVSAANVRVTLIHNAEAAKLVEGALTAQSNGDYTGTLLAPHAGRWEVRVRARRGEERFLATLHAEAP